MRNCGVRTARTAYSALGEIPDGEDRGPDSAGPAGGSPADSIFSRVPGDMDRDGTVDISDVHRLLKYVNGQAEFIKKNDSVERQYHVGA